MASLLLILSLVGAGGVSGLSASSTAVSSSSESNTAEAASTCSDNGLISGTQSTAEGGMGSWGCYDRNNGYSHGNCHTHSNYNGHSSTFHIHGNCPTTQGGIRQTFPTSSGEWKLKFECYAGDWDGGSDTDYVEISTNGGSSWTQYGCPPSGWSNIEHTFTASGSTDFIIWANYAECIDVDNIILESCTVATPSPTPGGASALGGASAVGDPHLQNVHGERFDLMKPGQHVMLNIPRGMSLENSLLLVQADAVKLGAHCADMYFHHVNITGSWAEAKQVGGYQYVASQQAVKPPEWIAFGPVFREVTLKVVHGITEGGLTYLNFFVKNLGRAGFVVGGLLGEDDHKYVSTPSKHCGREFTLESEEAKGGHVHGPSGTSVAAASFD